MPPRFRHRGYVPDQATVLVTTPRTQAAVLRGYDLPSCSLRMILHSDDGDDGDLDRDASVWSGKR